jgi:hypothetical protein
MAWPYPSREEDPWWDSFESFIAAVDASGFAHREDRSLIFSGGGTVTWTLGTKTLAWSAAIQISSPIGGFLLSIPAGSVTLDEGQVFYTTLVRQPLQNQNIVGASAQRLPQTPDGDNTIAIAIRIGDTIYFRTGLAIGPGGSAPGITPATPPLEVQDEGSTVESATTVMDFVGAAVTVTSPSPGQVEVAIGGGIEGWQADFADNYLYTQAAVAVEEVIGQGMFDGSRVSGGALVYFFGMMTPTFATTGTADFRLYDMGPAAGPPGAAVAIATLQATAGGGPQFKEQLLSVAGTPGVNQIANSERMYEVRVIMGGAPGDTLLIGGGGMDAR